MTPAMLQEATVAISREVEDDVGCDANGDGDEDEDEDEDEDDGDGDEDV